MSRIVTFYSYKGGVGRTLALANIGVLLAKRGKRVLLMDWDLEAPGLDRYFGSYFPQGFPSNRGTIFLLNEAIENGNADWRSHVQQVIVQSKNESPEANYTLSLITSGIGSTEYAQRVRGFSWTDFVQQKEGGPTLERWRDEWKSEFDFIFLDSRTGITDTGGICTILLPDFLVLVFTANNQSFEGGLGIVQSAQIERQSLAVPRPPLMILPLLSRFDRRDEVSEADKWLARFARDLKQPVFDAWLPTQFQPLQILELTKVPYVTKFSFGEPLPVLTHSLTDPELPNFYLENATRLLVTDFREAAQIIDPNAVAPQDTGSQINALIQRAPIDEIQLHGLLRQAEQEMGEGGKLASLLNNIGVALQDQARFATAEPFLRRALAIYEKSFGPEHPGVATGLNNLALLLQATNRLAEAEPLMERALAIDEKNFGPDNPNVSIRLNNLAQLLKATNRLAEAEPLMKRALAIDEKIYGPEHSNVAIRLNNLAQLLQATNRLVEAEPLMERALAIDEKSYGPDHPEVATDLNNLAQLFQVTNRLVEAEPLMQRVVEIFEKSLGKDHPKVAVALNNLALLLQATNRLNEAEPLLQRTLAIDEKSYGPDHPEVALDLHNLARLLQDMKRPTEAEPLMRRAVVTFVKFTQSTGHIHPRLKTAFLNYRRILETISLGDDEIASRIAQIGNEAGLDEVSYRRLLAELSK